MRVQCAIPGTSIYVYTKRQTRGNTSFQSHSRHAGAHTQTPRHTRHNARARRNTESIPAKSTSTNIRIYVLRSTYVPNFDARTSWQITRMYRYSISCLACRQRGTAERLILRETRRENKTTTNNNKSKTHVSRTYYMYASIHSTTPTSPFGSPDGPFVEPSDARAKSHPHALLFHPGHPTMSRTGTRPRKAGFSRPPSSLYRAPSRQGCVVNGHMT